jgi:hypothetical protein
VCAQGLRNMIAMLARQQDEQQNGGTTRHCQDPATDDAEASLLSAQLIEWLYDYPV